MGSVNLSNYKTVTSKSIVNKENEKKTSGSILNILNADITFLEKKIRTKAKRSVLF